MRVGVIDFLAEALFSAKNLLFLLSSRYIYVSPWWENVIQSIWQILLEVKVIIFYKKLEGVISGYR